MGDEVYIYGAALLVGMLVLQFALAMMGLSDFEFDGDLNADASSDVDVGLDSADHDGLVVGDLLGLRGVPFLIWLSALTAGFSAFGFFVTSFFSETQSVVTWGIRCAAFVVGLFFARGFCRFMRRVVPSVTTTAVSLSGARTLSGVVTDGVARLGTPAQVEVTDNYGAKHYFMAQPDHEAQYRKGDAVTLNRIVLDDGTVVRNIIKS